jgi:TRAP-type transport system periplasmic protein
MRSQIALTAIFCFGVCVFSTVQPVRGAAVKPIELKISHFASTDHQLHKDIFTPWVKMVEERTGGRVTATIFPSELLGKVKDSYDTVLAGTADISCAYLSSNPGRFPLMSVYELPFLSPNAITGSRVIWEHFQNEPRLRAEFNDVKVLWLNMTTPIGIHTTKKAIRKIDDINNMKIRTIAGLGVKVIKTLGGVPLVMPTPDIYTALERGTIDGTIIPFEGVKAFRLDEVTKYHTMAPLWSGVFFAVMNKKRWDSFPPDIQKAIESLSGPAGAELAGKSWDRADQIAIDAIKKLSNHEIIPLSPEETKKVRRIIAPIWDEWVAEKEAKGLPARKTLDDCVRLFDKHTK